jgi:multidrug efflux pump subunit AcrA (membrane-fusion protein)
MMCCCRQMLAIALVMASASASRAQDVKALVQQCVTTELAADDADHSHWLYLDVDRKPNRTTKQWVAETNQGDVDRLLQENGRELSQQDQRSRMESFAHDAAAQAKQRKSGQQDDQQARQMLTMLPQAFVWTRVTDQDGRTELHFKPNPDFKAPNREARVFAAMEGDMTVDDAQHRIASLKGRMIRDVKFGGGILGELRAGGSFEVERSELKPGIWQITETHTHIEGRALLFKSISDQEDEQKTEFRQLTQDLSFAGAEQLLMQQGE